MKKYILILAAVVFAAFAVYAATASKMAIWTHTDNSGNCFVYSFNRSDISKFDFTTNDQQILRKSDNTVLSTFPMADIDNQTVYRSYFDGTNFWLPKYQKDGSASSTSFSCGNASWGNHLCLGANGVATALTDNFTRNDIVRITFGSALSNAYFQIMPNASNYLFSNMPESQLAEDPGTNGEYVSYSGSYYDLKLSASDITKIKADGMAIGGSSSFSVTNIALRPTDDVIWGTGDNDANDNKDFAAGTNYSTTGEIVGTASTDPLNLKTLTAGDVVTFHFKGQGGHWRLLKDEAETTDLFGFMSNGSADNTLSGECTYTGTVTAADVAYINNTANTNHYVLQGYGCSLMYITNVEGQAPIYLIGQVANEGSSTNLGWVVNTGVALAATSTSGVYSGTVTFNGDDRTFSIVKELSSSWDTENASTNRFMGVNGTYSAAANLKVNGDAEPIQSFVAYTDQQTQDIKLSASKAGTFVCTVNLNTNTITLTKADDDVYVIGDVNGQTGNWDLNGHYVKLTETATGSNVYSGTVPVSNDGTFTLSSVIPGGSSTGDYTYVQNNGFGPNPSTTITSGTAVTFYANYPTNSFTIHKGGDYTFTVDMTAKTITVNPVSDVIYLVGEVGSYTAWPSVPNANYVTLAKESSGNIYSGTYTVTANSTSGSFAIMNKLADTWDAVIPYRYTPSGASTNVSVAVDGTTVSLANATSSAAYSFYPAATGTYTITVNLDNNTVALTAPAESSSITWSGSASIGSWGSSLRLYGDKVTLGTTQTGTLTGSISNYTFAEGDVIAITTDGSGAVQLGYGTGNTERSTDPYTGAFNESWSVSAGTNKYILSASEAATLNGLDAANRAICFNSGSSAFNITGIHIYHTTTTSLFSGTHDLSNWTNPLQITTSYTYQAGDVITVTTSSHDQIQLVGNSTASKTASVTSDRVLSCSFNSPNDYIVMSAATQTFTLSSADAELLNTSGNYLWVEGKGTVVTSVTVTR
jgi:hypothetical protein